MSKSSTRTARSAVAPKRSSRPPRTANWPRSSTCDDALVAHLDERRAHSSRSSSPPTSSVNECGRSAGSGTFSDSAGAETTSTGAPSPRGERVERGDAQPDEVRRRREVRLVGDAARGVEATRGAAPARRAGPPASSPAARSSGATTTVGPRRRAVREQRGEEVRAQRRGAECVAAVAGERDGAVALREMVEQRGERRHGAASTPSAASAAAPISSATSAAGSRKRCEHVRRDDLGIGRVGAADADADAPEVRRRPARCAATSGRCGRRGRRRGACGPRRRAGRSRRARRAPARAARRIAPRAGPTLRPDVVHPGERLEQRDAGPARARPALAQAAAVALARAPGSPQRPASSSATANPTLWRVPSYSRPGLPSPTTSQSTEGPRERSSGYSPSPADGSSAASPASSALRLGAGLADELRLLLDLLVLVDPQARRRERRDARSRRARRAA